METVEKVVEREVSAQEIYLLENCAKVVMSNGVEKYVSYRDLLTVIRAINDEVDNVVLEGFNLPSNVFFFGRGGDNVQVNTYFTSRPTTLKYLDSSFDIIAPNMILSHSLIRKNGKPDWIVQNTKYLCTDLPVGSLPKTFINGVNYTNRIFLSPFGNTYGGGEMCYGVNSMPTRFVDNNLKPLEWYYQFLWESPFNNDLGLPGVPGMSPEQWYKHLAAEAKKGNPFPYAKLSGFTPRS